MHVTRRSRLWIALTLIACMASIVTTVGHSTARAAADEANPGLSEKEARDLFETKIRPALVQHCYACHSADSKPLQGGLRVDFRDGLRRGGDSGPAVVPGKLAESLLLTAVDYSDPNLQMPPKGKLPIELINDFRRWIKSGAPDPRDAPAAPTKPTAPDLATGRKFWSFQPLTRPAAPPVQDPWVRTDIDRFVLARLRDKQLRPAPLVDRRLLIRRTYFDLIGLPPTPEEIEQFANDPDPRAYEKLLDRLLDSPHYGERWARHWLDLARYADSSGYENDNDRPLAYHYRDFVIEALQKDLPFDKFAQWQIAGDELEPLNPLAIKATGFLACGPMNGQVTDREAEKERYDVLDDWVTTIGTTFLGLTMGCARCHDHKFDPITSDDYYRFAANFTTTVRAIRNVDRSTDETRAALRTYEDKLDVAQRNLHRWEHVELEPLARNWLSTSPKLDRPLWLVLTASQLTSGGSQTTVVTKFDRREDGAYVVREANGEIATHTFEAEVRLDDLRALRLELLPDESLPKFGPGLGEQGDFQMHHITVTATPLQGDGQPVAVALTKVRSGTAHGAEPPAKANDAGGWSLAPPAPDTYWSIWEFAQPVRVAGGVRLKLQMRFSDDNPSGRKALGCFRFSVASGEGVPEPLGPDLELTKFVDGRAAMQLAEDKRTPAQQSALEQLAARYDEHWRGLWNALYELRRNRPWPTVDVALVTTEARGLVPMRMKIQGPDYYPRVFQLRRGSVEQKGPAAKPGVPLVLTSAASAEDVRLVRPPVKDPARGNLDRAALALWLTDSQQGAGHVVARVIVNRLWQHHLGRALVLTPSDFGAQGDRPVHPELLDWLASELIARQWSLKSLHKTIMMSAVYQQASSVGIQNYTGADRDDVQNAAAAARQADLDNRLFWSRPLVRLEGEVVRDAMLAASGRLDRRVFGPGTLDEAMTRRSIYFTVKRSRLIPSLVQLDWPDTLAGIGQRPTTTVAPQALLMLNNPHVRANAEALAAQLQQVEPLERALERAFVMTIGHGPTTAQRDAAHAFLERQAATYTGPDAKRSAWADFCQTLFSSNEFFYVP